MTIISNENFDAGATGWNSNATTQVGGESILGRFSGSQDIEKTFAIPQNQRPVAGYFITFDFYELDSWDNEEFYVYVDGKAVNLGRFDHRSDESENQKYGTTTDGIEWTLVSGELQQLSNTQHWDDQKHSVRLWVPQEVVTGDELTLRFDARLDGSVTDESYGIDNVVIDVHETPPMIMASENFDSGGAAGWSHRLISPIGGESVLGRFSGVQDVEKTFYVLTDADSYTVTFDFYELDSWDNEEFYVYVDDKAVNLGRFSHGTNESENIKSGTTDDGIEWSFVSGGRQQLSNTPYWADQKHSVTLLVPQAVVAGDELTVRFDARLNGSVTDESYGIDNVAVEANGTSTMIVASEDFDAGATGWNNNTTRTVGGENILGRFSGAQDVEKTFYVATDAYRYTVTFDFYELDSWDNEEFYVYVDDKAVNLGRFSHGTNESENIKSGTTDDGIEWSFVSGGRQQLSNTQHWADQKHSVTLLVSQEIVTGHELTVRFDARLNGSVTDESYGIDNVAVEANGTRMAASEGFESAANGWSINKTRIVGGAQILGHFSGAEDVEKTFDVSAAADSYSVSFDFYELDSWDNEEFYVYVDGKAVNLGRFSHGTNESENIKSGTTDDGIKWSFVSGERQQLSNTQHWADQKHSVTLMVQQEVVTGEELTLRFDARLNSSVADESYGIDNVVIESNIVATTDYLTRIVSQSYEVGQNFDVRENFEHHGPIGWSSFKTTTLDGVGTVMGRFDATDHVSKTFEVAVGVEGYRISFDFLELDSWDNEAFSVRVDGKSVNLGNFHVYSNEGAPNGGTTVDGIHWFRTSSTPEQIIGTAGPASWKDQIHHIDLWVPSDIVTDGMITVQFYADIDSGINDESYAIDNFVLSTQRARPDHIQEFLQLYTKLTDDNYPITHLTNWQLVMLSEYMSDGLENIDKFRTDFNVFIDNQYIIRQIGIDKNWVDDLVIAELNGHNSFSLATYNQMKDFGDLNQPEWGLSLYHMITAARSVTINSNRAEIESLMEPLQYPAYSDLVMFDADLVTNSRSNNKILADLTDFTFLRTVYGDKGTAIVEAIGALTLPNFEGDTLASFANDIQQEITKLETASNDLNGALQVDDQQRPNITIAEELALVSDTDLRDMLDKIDLSFVSMHKLDNWSKLLLDAVATEITSEFTSANISAGVGTALYLLGGAAFLAAPPVGAAAWAGSIGYFAGSTSFTGVSLKNYINTDYGIASLEYEIPEFNLDDITALDAFNFLLTEAEDRSEGNTDFDQIFSDIDTSSRAAFDAIDKFTDTSLFLMVLDGTQRFEIDRGADGGPQNKEDDLVREIQFKTTEMDHFLEDTFNVTVDWRVGTHGVASADNWGPRNGMGDWTEEGTIDIDFDVDDSSGDNVVGFQARVTEGFLGGDGLIISWHRDTDFRSRWEAIQDFYLSDVEWM